MQKTQFSQKLSSLELWCLLTTYSKSYMGFSKNRIHKIQDGWDLPSWKPVLILIISPQSSCHSVPVYEILSKSDHPRQKKWRHVDFRDGWSPILDFRGPVMGSLKSPCATSYRSSIDTVALNCLVFEKIAFFCTWRQIESQTNRQTDKRTNRWTAPMH